ncbi:MAG: hypothetical protein COA78_08945 [Blastopirellula sp.]|nr:MAG: hypothetical protein COA78_08945 [Blastopirellula sp.]
MGLRNQLIRIQLAFSEVHDLVKRSFRVNEANSSSSHLTQLEERVMLSATPLAVVDCPEDNAAEEPEAEVCVECPQSEDVRTEDEMLSSIESLDEQMSSLLNESTDPLDIVLIDSSLTDVDVLVDAVDESAIVLLYDGVNGMIIDVLAQVEALSETSGSEIASLSILSHGDGGQFDLGGQVVTTEMTAEQESAWRSLADNFTDDANIYVYGCEVVDGSGEGQQLLDALSLLTGTEVYGSIDTTGLGGDWDLEAVSIGGEDELAEGVIVPFDEAALSTYEGTLAVSNLVAHWTFDDGSGQTLTDISGNGNDGTLGSTSGSGSNDPTWTVDGTRGSVLTFDGIDDYVSGVADSPAGDFTIAGWGNTTSGGISGFHALYSADTEIWLGVGTNFGAIYLYVGGSDGYLRSADSTWTEDTWHHLAGSWDGTTAHVYLDGVEIMMSTFGTLNDPVATTAVIGVWSVSLSDDLWHGSIDDLAIFDEALDSTTINKLANDSPFAVDSTLSTDESVDVTTGDVFSTSFEPNGDTLSIDSYSQGTDGTVTYNNDGTFTYTPDANFYGVDTFTYTITDGNSNTDTATITVTVNDVAPTITSRETVDADNDGQIDQIKITTDQNLDDDFSGLTITVAGYTVTGYSSDIANDNIFYVDLTESGTPDTGAVPLVTVTVNTTLSDATGNSIAVAAGVAAADKAAPVVVSMVMSDTALIAGETSTLTVTYSEAVQAASGLMPQNGTLSVATTADGGVTWTSTFTPTDGIVDPTNLIFLVGTQKDLANNSVFVVEATSNYTIETTTPTITARETIDSDSDGQIDQIKITTSENLDDDFSGLTITVAGYTVTGYSSDIANDNIFYVNLTESFTPDTGITPTVTVTSNTTLSDASGNNITVDAGVTATDKAAAVIVSATATVGSTELTVTFSEAVDTSNAGVGNLLASDFGFVNVSGDGATSISSIGGDADGTDNVVTITLDTPFVASDFNTDTIAAAAGQIYDLADIAVDTTAVTITNTDVKAPTITTRETIDADSDGQIDQIKITTDENLNDDFSGLTITVAGYTVTSYSSDIANDNIFYVNLTESGTSDTGVIPTVTLTANTTLSDVSNNNIDLDYNWWDTDWQNRTKITFNNSNSSVDLSDFPVLISLTGTNIDFDKIKADGADIRFVDNDGTLLNYQIESWDDGTETASIWVKVQQLDQASNTDFIHLYYNNGAASDAQNAAGVWGANYSAVLHLNETVTDGDTSGTHIDSTGTNTASQNYNDDITGLIGQGQYFDGTDDYIVIDDDDSLSFGNGSTDSPFSLSAWINRDSGGDRGVILSKDNFTNVEYEFWVGGSDKLNFNLHDSGGDILSVKSSVLIGTDWTHVTATYDGSGNISGLKLYVDGQEVAVTDTSSGVYDAMSNTSYNLNIGEGGYTDDYDFDGIIDEVRVSSTERSADWIEASYLSQSGLFTFTNFGNEQLQLSTADSAVPVVSITRDDANPTNASSVVFSVDFSEDVTNVDVSDFELALSGVTANSMITLGNAGDSDDSTYTITVDTVAGNGTLGLDIAGGNNITDLATNSLSSTLNADEEYTIDNIDPTVSITRDDANPTNALTVHFSVDFSEDVTGVDASDFDLSLSGVTANSVVVVSDAGDSDASTYTITVNNIAGNGQLGLELSGSHNITDMATNTVDSTPPVDEEYDAIDNTKPTVAITRDDANPTNANSVVFSVDFSENVTGVDAADFTLALSGVTTNNTIVIGDAGDSDISTYTVTVSMIDGNGTLALNIAGSNNIKDIATNTLDLTPTTNENYDIDNIAPTVTSIETVDIDSDGYIDAIHITFSEAVDDSTINTNDWNITGVTGAAFSSTTNSDTANDTDIYITFTDAVLDTGITPNVSYAQGTLADPSGNLLASNNPFTGIATTSDKAAPVITASQSFNISELAANMASVGTVATTESGALQDWTITAGNGDNIFAINSTSGEITIADNTNLNYEATTSYTLSISLSDGANTSAIETVTINVTNINEAPTNTVPSTQAVDEETTTGFSGISISDTDAGSNNLTTRLQVSNGIVNITLSGSASISAGTNGTGDLTIQGSVTDINNTLSSLTYTGDTDVVGTNADTLTITTNDLGNTGSGGAKQVIDTIQIDIGDVNDAPTATNNTVITNEDIDHVFSASDFNFTDIDGDTLASVQITSLETAGALQLSGSDVVLNQVITRADIDAENLIFAPVMGESGTGYDSFEFSVNDGTVDSLSSYVMTVDVTLVNSAPTATGELYSILQTEVLNVTSPGIIANDQDVDGDPLTAVLVSNVSQGVLTLSSDGSFTYTPDLSFFGTDSFTYAAFDGLASSPTVTVTIEVEALGHVVEEPVEEEPAADPEPEPEPTPEAEPVVESEPVIEESNPEAEEATSASPEGVRPPTQATKKETASAKDAKQATESQDSAEADAESEELLVTASQQSTRGSDAAQYRTSQNDRTSQYSRSKSIDISQETAVNLMSSFEQWSTEIDQKDIDGPQLTLGIETSSVITVLSIGYVIWSIRGGLFLTSFVSVVPTWSFFDPLPILNSELESFSSAGEEESLSDLTKSE